MAKLDRLTDKWLRSAKTTKAMEDFWDGSRPGLYARVFPSGTIKLFYSYRSPVDGAKRNLPLGRFDPESSIPAKRFTLGDAVAAWQVATGQVAGGVDPNPKAIVPASKRADSFDPTQGSPRAYHLGLREIFGEDPLQKDSFGDLARDYLVLHAWPGKRRTRDDEGMLRRDLLPRWRDRPAGEIEPEDVIALTDAIVARGAPRSAEHVRLLISRVYNFSIGRARRFHNPAFKVTVTGGKSRVRKRWLSDAEIVKLWRGLDMMGTVFAARIRAELILMQRPGEVAAMELSELQPDGWWIIPGEKRIPIGGKELEVGTKNKLDHAVFLPPLFWEMVEPIRPLFDGGRFIFPSPKALGQPLWNVNKMLTKLAAELKMKHLTPHDLRRTGTTNLQRLGFSLMVDPVVNHVPRGVRRSYNLWEFREEKKVAMLAWETHLRGILGLG